MTATPAPETLRIAATKHYKGHAVSTHRVARVEVEGGIVRLYTADRERWDGLLARFHFHLIDGVYRFRVRPVCADPEEAFR